MESSIMNLETPAGIVTTNQKYKSTPYARIEEQDDETEDIQENHNYVHETINAIEWPYSHP